MAQLRIIIFVILIVDKIIHFAINIYIKSNVQLYICNINVYNIAFLIYNRLNIITNKNKNLLPTIRNCIYNIYIKLGMHCIFGKSGIIRYFLLSG